MLFSTRLVAQGILVLLISTLSTQVFCRRLKRRKYCMDYDFNRTCTLYDHSRSGVVLWRPSTVKEMFSRY